ncbi:MAG TPA: hypothetical protein VK470_12240, partial [Bacteroidota bacterium]|nr:hypothetical protein [Bacteroidota bacterium]
MKIIGIVGTAKNTGKTTTLGAMIAESAAHQERLAVTSIGYDGEEIDTITGLPKPRLFLRTGTIVITSERCLAQTSAEFRVLTRTDVETALGRIAIVEITRDGLIVLAGPNTKKLLRGIIDELGQYGVDRMFVDGSFNRIAAMAAVETMIITTGASRSRETGFLSDESRAICRLFDLPQFVFTSHD